MASVEVAGEEEEKKEEPERAQMAQAVGEKIVKEVLEQRISADLSVEKQAIDQKERDMIKHKEAFTIVWLNLSLRNVLQAYDKSKNCEKDLNDLKES